MTPPSSCEARLVSTSFTFMLLCVPDPVCHTTRGNSSSCRPASTSRTASPIAAALAASSSPSVTFTCAATPFT
jgi:hypothetical protein